MSEKEEQQGFSNGTSVKSAHVWEEPNLRFRYSMEDAHVLIDNFMGEETTGVFGVYDGHGGDAASKFVETRLHENLEKELKKVEKADIDWDAVWKKVFNETDQQLLDELKEEDAGTTVVVCLVRYNENNQKVIYTANCGDARAVLISKKAEEGKQETSEEGASTEETAENTETDNQESTEDATEQSTETEAEEPQESQEEVSEADTEVNDSGDEEEGPSVSLVGKRLSYDHKPNLPEEVDRIVKAGGIVIRNRVNASLAVSRAIGDHGMKLYVPSDPYVSEHVVTEDDVLLVVACDGVWDVFTDEQLAEALEERVANGDTNTDDVSKWIVEASIERGSTDNVTCIAVLL